MLETLGAFKSRKQAILRRLFLGSLACLLTVAGRAATLPTASVALAWDPSTDANVVGYNLYYGVVSQAYTNQIAVGNTTNATVAGLVPGTTYYFAATAYNSLGLESDFSNEAVYSVPLPPPNQPPTLDPLPDLVVGGNGRAQVIPLTGLTAGGTNEQQVLTVTARSSNPALIPDPAVSYTSPSATGSLSLVPSARAYGSATITVTVDDGQTTNNLVARSFSVTVCSSIPLVDLGNAVVQSGQSSSLPVTINSSVALGGISLTFSLPAENLTNPVLQNLAPEIDPASATLVAQGGSAWTLSLAARSGQTILGSHSLAALAFTAVPGQHTAALPLNPLQVSAILPDASPATNTLALAGRVVVVGPEALLEAAQAPDGSRSLKLYGNPPATYTIEYAPDLGGGSWTRLPGNVTLTSPVASVSLTNSIPGLVFYRAVQANLNN